MVNQHWLRVGGVLGLALFILSGCSSTAKDLGEAGAFETQEVSCTDSGGNEYKGSAEACMVLARAQVEKEKSKVEDARALALSSACDGMETPSGNSGKEAWSEYYRSCADAKQDVAMSQLGQGVSESAGGSTRDAYPQRNVDGSTILASEALRAESREKVAYINGGFNLATFGIASFRDILGDKYEYKTEKAMWESVGRPNFNVSGFGTPGKAYAEGEGGATVSSTRSPHIIAYESAVGIENSRANYNRDGQQGIAYDEAASNVARNLTDPTQLNSVCDDGDSLCDGASAPFLQQQNPSTVDVRNGFGR